MERLGPNERDRSAFVVFSHAFADAGSANAGADDEIVALNHLRELDLKKWVHMLARKNSIFRRKRDLSQVLVGQSTARQMMTEAITPVRSASRPAGMACRVCLIPTDPK